MNAIGTSEEIAVVEHTTQLAVQVAPQVEAAELVRRLAVIKDAMNQAMEKDVDYGVIPGTGTKPTLLKPGAEKLGALFQLDVQLENEKIWHDDGHLTVICRATVYHQPTGTRLGSGEGICTTREAKYAYRKGERICPTCQVPAIIKGKAEFGGGWVCWTKKDGCGAKFSDGEAAIEDQKTERIPNEDIADSYNTADKMASKRARIDAVLAVTGASALFTQDIEDFAGASESEPATASDLPSTATSQETASDAQKKYLIRLCAEKGVAPPNLDTLTKPEASKLIEDIKAGKAQEPYGEGVDEEDIPF